MTSLATALMFVRDQAGKAEEAMNLYVSLFDDSEIELIARYEPGEGDVEGTVKHARFTLGGRKFVAMDSSGPHEFTFTPATSVFAEFDTAEELDRVYGGLIEGGTELMELGEYPFSPHYAWINDRFGVSWQLFVPA